MGVGRAVEGVSMISGTIFVVVLGKSLCTFRSFLFDIKYGPIDTKLFFRMTLVRVAIK